MKKKISTSLFIALAAFSIIYYFPGKTRGCRVANWFPNSEPTVIKLVQNVLYEEQCLLHFIIIHLLSGVHICIIYLIFKSCKHNQVLINDIYLLSGLKTGIVELQICFTFWQQSDSKQISNSLL